MAHHAVARQDLDRAVDLVREAHQAEQAADGARRQERSARGRGDSVEADTWRDQRRAEEYRARQAHAEFAGLFRRFHVQKQVAAYGADVCREAGSLALAKALEERSGEMQFCKEACFQALTDQYQPGLVRRLERQYSGNLQSEPQFADAIASWTFFKVHSVIINGAYKAIGTFRGWLWRIATNRARSEHRGRRNHLYVADLQVTDDEEEPCPFDLEDNWVTEALDVLVREELVWRLLEEVPKDLASIFQLRRIEGLRPHQIMKATGFSKEHVSRKLHQAANALRSVFVRFWLSKVGSQLAADDVDILSCVDRDGWTPGRYCQERKFSKAEYKVLIKRARSALLREIFTYLSRHVIR